MNCPLRMRLQKKHQKASASFDAARARLNERIGVCAKGEFLSLSGTLDQAWQDLDNARTSLDDHIREHCCMTQETSAPQ